MNTFFDVATRSGLQRSRLLSSLHWFDVLGFLRVCFSAHLFSFFVRPRFNAVLRSGIPDIVSCRRFCIPFYSDSLESTDFAWVTPVLVQRN